MDIAGNSDGVGGDDIAGDALALTTGDSELAAMAAAKMAFWGEIRRLEKRENIEIDITVIGLFCSFDHHLDPERDGSESREGDELEGPRPRGPQHDDQRLEPARQRRLRVELQQPSVSRLFVVFAV